MLSNGIRSQMNSDNWESGQKLTKGTSINRNTYNYSQENQMNKYKTEYLEKQPKICVLQWRQAKQRTAV